ncbi:MAG TPA: pyruvate kinase [Acidimicrobiales bacterium]|nr:pyruvate kinase [Acidimicrobiales bacterium]
MERRTKIVATLGPASDAPDVVRKMIDAGMNMARLSLAHGPVEETLDRVEVVRRAAADAKRTIGVLIDLPGPKIRTADFAREMYLTEGESVELVPGGDGATSDWRRIAVDHPEVVAHLEAGDRVRLGDGVVTLVVEEADGDRAVARIDSGGRLMGRPGVSLSSTRFRMESPTAEDLRLLDIVCRADIDAVAISFVRSAADVERVRGATGQDGPMLVAKIETQEAVDALESVIAVTDGVMVARGDLGLRCALEDVPHYQKRIIATGVSYGLPVITATQMLESMLHAPSPTRAEVSDVANAVLDGTSALMLSGETAVGHDPVEAVATMARIATRAEKEFDYLGWGRARGMQQVAESRGKSASRRVTAALSAAAWRAATDAGATVIIACTNSGTTARSISRFRPVVPILGVTPSARTARQLSVAWGITPIFSQERSTTDDIIWFAVKEAVDAGMAKKGDIVAVLVGWTVEPVPTTDTLRLVRI